MKAWRSEEESQFFKRNLEMRSCRTLTRCTAGKGGAGAGWLRATAAGHMVHDSELFLHFIRAGQHSGEENYQ